MPRPRLTDEPARPRSIILPDALWAKMQLLGNERKCSASQIGRIAIEQYVKLNAPKTVDLTDVPYWTVQEWYDEHRLPVHAGKMPLAGECIVCDVVVNRGF